MEVGVGITIIGEGHLGEGEVIVIGGSMRFRAIFEEIFVYMMEYYYEVTNELMQILQLLSFKSNSP